MVVIGSIIHWIIQLIILIILVDVILSYFVSPFNNIRQFLDRIVEPMLRPIRKILPQTGSIDFSPMVLVIGLILLDTLIQNIIIRL